MMSVDAENVLFTDLKDMVVRIFRHEGRKPEPLLRCGDGSLARARHRNRFQMPPAGAEESSIKCLQVHGERRCTPRNFGGRAAAGAPTTRPWIRPRSVVAFEVCDHRNRYRAREAKKHFRGVSTGPMPALAGNTAGPVWASRLAVSWQHSSPAKFSLQSTPGQGSVFTLYLPLEYAGPTAAQRAVTVGCSNAEHSHGGAPHRRRSLDDPR